MSELKKIAKVIGVSSNNIEEHIEFKKKYGLNFILLSDKLNKLKKAFIEHSKDFTNIKRSTFIIDKNGEIMKSWEKVDVEGHIEDIIKYFNSVN